MAVSGKRIAKIYESFDRFAEHEIADAVKIVQDAKKTNFDETVEIAINLGVDPRHADQMVRGVVSLPNGTGKSVVVAVFAKEDKAKEATEAGAEYVGAEDLAGKIQKSEIEFDRCIATPDMMAVVGRLGKVLGPKGLMPNPKLGTVTQNIGEAVKSVKGGEIEFRVEKAGIVHAGIGKTSFTHGALVENLNAFLAAIVKAKPTGSKGVYVKRATLSSTMGPGVKIDTSILSG
jgi:large subunit ribosomal protein L1